MVAATSQVMKKRRLKSAATVEFGLSDFETHFCNPFIIKEIRWTFQYFQIGLESSSQLEVRMPPSKILVQTIAKVKAHYS